MPGFSVTVERYFLHDEDEVCEADEGGFIIRDVSLRDAMRLGLEYSRPECSGSCHPNTFPPHNVRWLTFDEWNEGTREQIEQGIHESRSLHFPNNLTESSRGRVCRLFGAYGCK